MTVIANRRSVMTLFSKPADPWSHRTRLVLCRERASAIDIVDVDDGNLPEDLLDLNPYNSVPTLVDRDLVLYDSRVIMEYLDERFPHPPLMPVDPVTRAQFRLALFRIERDWYSLADEIGGGVERKPTGARGQGARGEHPVERRDLRGEEVLLERRVLARRLHDRRRSSGACRCSASSCRRKRGRFSATWTTSSRGRRSRRASPEFEQEIRQ